jgi:signal transduction histidine kinase
MARSHGGDVTYQPRAGGGSCFTLALPLSPRKS